MSELLELTIGELGRLIESRALSPVELVGAQLDRIARLDGQLRSFAHVSAEAATAQAKVAEDEIAAGERRGPLHGVPLGIKDLFWTTDAPTAAGSLVHRGFRAPEDATAVRRLREAGAILVGKLEMTEGAYSDHHPTIDPPKNPWNAEYWPGISSSGPGVAVAAGLCCGALASDTGGSIRWPSAQNGVVGIKPSWGRVSRHGTFELAASLDHVGVMARSAADAALLLRAIAGPDPADSTVIFAPPIAPSTEPGDLSGVSVGIDPGWIGAADPVVSGVIAAAAETLQSLGAELVEVDAPDVTDAVRDWPANCAVEAAVAHRATYPARKDDYGPVLASVLEAGLSLSGVGYQELLLRRMALRGRFAALFARIDLLLAPVHPFAPLTLETISTLGAQPELVAELQRLTCPFDMTGSPTITLPGGADAAGMPIGFQLVAGDLKEDLLIRAGMAFEGATDWSRRRPTF